MFAHVFCQLFFFLSFSTFGALPCERDHLTKAPFTHPSFFPPCKTLLSKPDSKSHVKLSHALFLPISTSLFSPPIEAKAFTLPKEEIVSSLTQVEQAIDQVEELGSGILDAVKPSIDAVVPIVQQAGEEALNVASPVISEAMKIAQDAMESSGIDTEQFANAAKTVTSVAGQTIEDVKPIASSTVETILNSDPFLIVESAAALFLAYLLVPPVLSAISFKLRGYKGVLTPIQTLHLMCTQNYFLIDIRSEKDKNKAGIPLLPSIAKACMIATPLEELPIKMRTRVKNAKKMETEIVALKISYLKRLKKSSNIVIMDSNSYSDTAKIVAQTLTSLGFKNCWIMADGFSGTNGWLKTHLGSESYDSSFAESLSPPSIFPGGGAQLLGTVSSIVQTSRSFLN